MAESSAGAMWRWRLAGVAAGAWLAGCASLSPGPDPVSAPTVRFHVPTGIIVLQSDDSPAYADVTRELVRQWRGGLEVVHLNEDGDLGAEARGQIQSSGKPFVVAVGLAAARAARSLSGKKVVFCQVFNYAEHDFVRPWMKGVSAVPPVGLQFRAWKAQDPGLARVAVIAGVGLRDLMAEARAAALEHGIKLHHVEVNSDLALRYAYAQLAPEVQGLWLVPDNRVLSVDVLRDVFALSRKRGQQIMVMNDQLLAWGGTLSAESDPADVAGRVLARVREAAGYAAIPGPDITPLTKVNIKSNPTQGPRPGLASSDRATHVR